MKFRLSPRTVRRLAPAVVTPLAASWRYRLHHADRWHDLVRQGGAFIFLLWHEAWLPLLWHHRHQNVAIMVSDGREGQYLADYARRIGYHAVQGSSSRGATRALLGAIRALEQGTTVAITPDGPRGPRRMIKPGVIHAAQRTGARILPLHARAHPAWLLRSWDRTIVPKPLARVDLAYGEPFTIPPGPDGICQGTLRCAEALAQVEALLPE